MAHLEELPSELLGHIFVLLDSLQDLHAIIKASPKCFRVYKTSPGIFLTAVLTNAIHPDTLYDALAVTYMRGQPFKYLHQKQEIVDFLDGYFRHDTTKIHFPRDVPSIIILAKLYAQVCRLADHYCRHALHALYSSEVRLRSIIRHNIDLLEGIQASEQKPSSIYVNGHSEVSATERARVHRAFYRYELYTLCFPVNRETCESLLSSSTQYHHFIRKMGPWEVEELSCLGQHLQLQVATCQVRVENELVDRVLLAASERDENSRAVRDPPFLFGQRYYGTYMFDDDGQDGMWSAFEYMASLGLTFLESLIFGNSQTITQIIRRHCYLEAREFIQHAIEETYGTDLEPVSLDKPTDNHISHANLGYYLTQSDENLQRARSDSAQRPRRLRGFVFWDIERVSDPEVKARIVEANDAGWPSSDYVGVQERLRGVPIPNTLAEQLLADYEIDTLDSPVDSDWEKY